jgi:peptidoglycan/xylan/chitin deacetylase (PgdA/CDA1 family)
MAINSLVMHRVVDEEPESFEDTPNLLLKYILETYKNKISTIDVAISEYSDKQNHLCLTFDDGNNSDFTHVLPALLRYKINANFFIVSDWIGKPKHLSKRQIIELYKSGNQIGSHSKSHPNFTQISRNQRLLELKESKAKLEDIICAQVSTFAFPFGFENKHVIDEVFEAGYLFCCTSKHGVADVGQKVLPRNSINRTFTQEKASRAIIATNYQKLTWGFEDSIKKQLKQLSPNLYKQLRSIMS